MNRTQSTLGDAVSIRREHVAPRALQNSRNIRNSRRFRELRNIRKIRNLRKICQLRTLRNLRDLRNGRNLHRLPTSRDSRRLYLARHAAEVGGGV